MAARYWVGGAATANWNEATGGITNWGSASNTRDNASVPATGDDVIFDNSANGNSPCTINVSTNYLNSFNTGAYTNTLTHNTAITLNTQGGSGITFGAGMTYNPTSSSIIYIGGGETLTTNGKLMPNITVGGGNLTLGDNLTFINSKIVAITINSGRIIDLNGKTLSGYSITSRILLKSDIVGSSRQITVSSGTFANADFQDITFSNGGNDLDLSAITGGSGDCGGNSNATGGKTVTFNTSATQTLTMSSGSNNVSTATWSGRVPLPQDDVDCGSVTGGTLVMDMPRSGRSWTWTGATGTPTWNFGSTANSIYGGITLISGMSISGSQILTFAGRGAYNLTMAGKSFIANTLLAAPGGSISQQDIYTNSQSLTVSHGNWITNNYAVFALAVIAAFASSAVRQITPGTTIFNLTATVATALWDLGGDSNITFSGPNSTIIIQNASSNNRSLSLRNKTYGTLTYTVAGSTGKLTITGSNSFDTINFSDANNARTLEFTAGTTTTIRNLNGFNVQGTSGKLMTIQSATASGHIISSTQRQVCRYISVSRSTAQGGGSFYAVDSTDGGNNSGWIFGAPPSSGGGIGSPGIPNLQNLQSLRSL